MGLFDLFKGKKPEIKPTVDVRLDNLDSIIDEKKNVSLIKETSILNQIKNQTKNLIKDLEEKLIILENIDLNQKKVEERVRLIVKENLFYFIYNLRKLIDNIKDLENEDINKFVEELNKKFFDFEKKSLINYEKATFLIGKELGSVKDSISVFFRDLNKNLNENKELFDNIKIINITKKNLEELKELNKRKNEAEENLKKIEEEISRLAKENELFEKTINKIKRSDAYKDEIKNELLINGKKQQYEKDLLKLRELVNFKALTNNFHSNEKIMNKINNYKNNFKETFENNDELISLLKEAGLETSQISEKISKLNSDKENLENLKKNKQEIEIKHINNIQSNIKKNHSEIENLNNEKSKELKLIQKFDKTSKELVNGLKQELIKINLNLIDD